MAHFKHTYLSIFFADYKIRSRRFLAGALYLTLLVLVVLIGSEVLFNLPTSSLEVQMPALVVNILLLIAYVKKLNVKVLQSLFLVYIFALLEGHIWVNPHSFHTLIYWFPFIPVAAIIVAGLRQAIFWLLTVIVVNTVNLAYVQQLSGDSYEITVPLIPLYIIGLVFTLTMFTYTFFLYKLLGEAYVKMKTKSDDLEKITATSKNKKKKLMGYQKTLFDLSKDRILTSGDFQTVYKKICKIAAQNLGVNRVSIWIFENKSTVLRRKYLFSLLNEQDQIEKLTKEAFPNYFQKILSDHLIIADDTFVNPDVREFMEGYLQPLQVRSLLDSPINLDGKTIGIICCENQNSFHTWSAEDILFVQSLSDFVALAFKSAEVRSLLQKIRTQNRDLKEKGKEIEAYNEELSALNEELKITNESLEVAVQHRTSALEKQNKQLSEYAFINSHLLRAPLSRILGLTYIISKEKLDIKDSSLLNALTTASQDLDSIVRKISALLYKREDFNRDDINEIIQRKFKDESSN